MNNQNPQRRPLPKGQGSNTVSRRNRRPRSNGMPNNVGSSNFSTAAVVVIAVLLLINYKIFSSVITNQVPVPVADNVNSGQTDNTSTEPQNPYAEEIARDFVPITVTNEDTRCGNLILVNNTHAFDFEASSTLCGSEELVSIGALKTNDYYISFNTETLTPTAIEAFNQLTADFAKETGHRDLIIVDSIRTKEDQQRMLEEKGPEIATNPGHSEHHTGLAFDLSLYSNGVYGTFDGTGDYAWIAKNCYKYGYIVRYPETKTDITGIIYEPWHMRYVGKEHAYFMTLNNLCLEEYVELLSRYPLESPRLHFTTADGTGYTVYSQSVLGDSATVYVPRNAEYFLSGDNDGRIIVTCKNPA